MCYLGIKDWGFAIVLFLLYSSFCELANCKGGSIKMHLVSSNQFIHKSHQSLLLDDIQRYETSPEIEKENASLEELDFKLKS